MGRLGQINYIIISKAASNRVNINVMIRCCSSVAQLLPVPQMGPCKGRGHDRNCSGGRWLQVGCKSYRGHGTGHPRKTLRHPQDAGGLSLVCSPGSLCLHPVKAPKVRKKRWLQISRTDLHQLQIWKKLFSMKKKKKTFSREEKSFIRLLCYFI